MPWALIGNRTCLCNVDIVICVSGRIQKALLRMVNQSLFVAFACFAALTLSVNGLDLRARYVAYNEEGEPEHVHIDLSKRCPKKGCFNKGRLTSDCSCKCRGFWHGDLMENKRI